ncbi:MAG: phospholipase D-like domain-containing protein [Muribaculum sp.]|nr:phospholipase D-like domain-containing protein [Muribaculum sp.]
MGNHTGNPIKTQRENRIGNPADVSRKNKWTIAGKAAGCAAKLLGLWLLYLIFCLTIPPLYHKSGGEVPSGVNADSDGVGRDAAGVNQDLDGGACRERVLSIDDNGSALLWRLRLIETAQERLVLATFDFRDDNSGQDIMAALYHAADRGVEVQILVDGINGMLYLEDSMHFQELAAHEHVQVKLYNPVDLLTPWKANYRMHDKYLMADDVAYLLGGRNTDDLFLGNYADSYNEDRDLVVYGTVPGEGNSYRQLADYFEQVWNLSCCKPFGQKTYQGGYLAAHYERVRDKYPEACAETAAAQVQTAEEETGRQEVQAGQTAEEETGWQEAQAGRTVWETCWKPELEQTAIEARSVELWTNPMEPENKEPLLWSRMLGQMKQAEDILIQTPYIICSEEMYSGLTGLIEGGAGVEVVTNAVESGTNPFGCTDYLNQKERILGTGMHVYEYLGDQALHTKTVLAGDHISMVGSCNLDMRSIYLDTEMMLVIDSTELNARLREQARTLQEGSRHVCPDGTETEGIAFVPVEQGMGKKIVYGVLRVLIRPFRHVL